MHAVSSESCHCRVFVKLCLNGVEFKMIALLRRKLEEVERLWDSLQAIEPSFKSTGLLSPVASLLPGQARVWFLGGGRVGGTTDSACPGLREYPG